MGPIDHNERIKSIVEKPVPPDGEVLDYIAECITDPSTTRHFMQHARRLDWLHWIEDQGSFAKLFESNSSLSRIDAEVEQTLGYWFAREFAFTEQNAALCILLRKGGSLGPILWHTIAHTAFSSKPEFENLKRWIPVLLQTRPAGMPTEFARHAPGFQSE
jgi:hypothetical protein